MDRRWADYWKIVVTHVTFEYGHICLRDDRGIITNVPLWKILRTQEFPDGGICYLITEEQTLELHFKEQVVREGYKKRILDHIHMVRNELR